MNGKVSFYGSMGALVVFVYAIIAIYGGVSAFLYAVLIPALIALIHYLLGKIFSEFWIGVIFSSLIVIGLYYFTRLWNITILFACFFVFTFIAVCVIKSKKWSKVTIVVIGILFISILMFIVLKEDFREQSPEVTEKNIDITVNEMENNEEVKEAWINIKDNSIYCGLIVEEPVSDKDKEKLGEELVKMLASEVEEDNNSKKLYDHYSLTITIGTNGNDDNIHGGIDINSEDNDVTWNIYEKQLSNQGS